MMRLGIVRLTSLGDVVHTLPLAHALRQALPDAYLVWIVEEREASLLTGRPLLDEVIHAPTRRWRHGLRTTRGALRVAAEWAALHRRLRALKLDAVIDVQGLLKSSLFTAMTHAPLRVGFGWTQAREPLSSLFVNRRVRPPAEAVHVVDRNLCLLGPLGLRRGEIVFPIPVDKTAETRVDELWERHSVKGDTRLVALLPATRGPAKQWPPGHFLDVALQLIRETRVKIVLVGGPGEEALLDEIAGPLGPERAFTFTSPLGELIALLKRTHLTLGNDTGPLHVAAALGRPTIGLFGPTSSRRNGPYGPRARSIQSPTGRMKDIPVDAVLPVAQNLLAQDP